MVFLQQSSHVQVLVLVKFVDDKIEDTREKVYKGMIQELMTMMMMIVMTVLFKVQRVLVLDIQRVEVGIGAEMILLSNNIIEHSTKGDSNTNIWKIIQFA